MRKYPEPNTKEHDSFLQSLDLDAYWQEQMERRYCIRDEVWRLEVVLKGHYFDECEFRRKSNRELRDLIEFYHSKRPYGNKNIPKSIAYQLGWDPGLIIGKSSLAGNETFPPHIEKEAMTCHDLLLEELKKG